MAVVRAVALDADDVGGARGVGDVGGDDRDRQHLWGIAGNG